MKVVFTRTAELALEKIADFIAEDSPVRALTFVEELRAAALALGDMPKAYPLAPRYETLGVRRRVHGAYLILYRIEADRVTILLIVHGARDYGNLLETEG